MRDLPSAPPDVWMTTPSPPQPHLAISDVVQCNRITIPFRTIIVAMDYIPTSIGIMVRYTYRVLSYRWFDPAQPIPPSLGITYVIHMYNIRIRIIRMYYRRYYILTIRMYEQVRTLREQYLTYLSIRIILMMIIRRLASDRSVSDQLASASPA